jgi:hypothetical protein
MNTRGRPCLQRVFGSTSTSLTPCAARLEAEGKKFEPGGSIDDEEKRRRDFPLRLWRTGLLRLFRDATTHRLEANQAKAQQGDGGTTIRHRRR